MLLSPFSALNRRGRSKEETEAEEEDEEDEMDMVSTISFIQANPQQHCCIQGYL
jgi:hypothetical protein